MPSRPDHATSIASGIAAAAIVTSFLFPGVRVAGVPLAPPAFAALLFAVSARKAFSPAHFRLVATCLLLFGGLLLLNAARYGFELRSLLYWLIPLSAIGSAAMMKALVDRFGMERVLRLVLGLCALNTAVMFLQAIDFGSINSALMPLWLSNISFVATTPEQQEILSLTIPIRPPGFFPTGIFASTAIYVACRAAYLHSRVAWPLLLALLGILLAANRTLAAFFFLFETVAFVHAFGLLRFIGRAAVVGLVIVVMVGGIASVSGDLYLFQFLGDELASGDIESTASVVERLKTVDFFLEYAPEHALLGGFSSSQLESLDHVFDSEILLRTLQFGVFGVLALACIILVPRSGRPGRDWIFLFVLAGVASLTTTFATSVIYAPVIALYREVTARRRSSRTYRLIGWAEPMREWPRIAADRGDGR